MRSACLISQPVPKLLKVHSDTASSDKALMRSGLELWKSSPALAFPLCSYCLWEPYVLISGKYFFFFFLPQWANQNVSSSAAVAQTEQSQKALAATRCSEGQVKRSKRGPGTQTLQMFLLFLLLLLHYCFTWSAMIGFSYCFYKAIFQFCMGALQFPLHQPPRTPAGATAKR